MDTFSEHCYHNGLIFSLFDAQFHVKIQIYAFIYCMQFTCRASAYHVPIWESSYTSLINLGLNFGSILHRMFEHKKQNPVQVLQHKCY